MRPVLAVMTAAAADVEAEEVSVVEAEEVSVVEAEAATDSWLSLIIKGGYSERTR
jgi:hypothetical protein